MSCTEHISTQIRSHGFRLTPQRLAILQVLHHSGRHLTPVEVYQLAHASVPGLTEATVYRTLEFLIENGFAQAGQSTNGKLVYEVADQDHHHVVCRKCHKEMQIAHGDLEKLYHEIEQSTGYRLTVSHLTFVGLCPDCQKNSM